ncbi:MAG TPA: hypothetical protein VF338_02660 [Leptolinea sp.]
MKRFFALMILLVVIMVPSSVKAQTGIEFSKMVINIWPEYDQPGVLVFYRIILSGQTSLPSTLTIRIPRAAEKPFNVKMKDVDGRMDTLRSTSTIEGDWIKVAFTTPVPEVQFEYYDPSITVTGNLHEYQYLWPGDFNIASLVLSIQQPLAVENFQIEPAMGTGRVNQDGFTYFESIVGEVKSGVVFNVKLKYEKTGTDLSAPSQSVSPVEPISTNTLGWRTLNEVLPYFLSGLGILLIIAGIYWYWRSGKTITAAFLKRTSSSRNKELESEPVIVYCHRCGRKAISGDVFCRSCGTKLRVE